MAELLGSGGSGGIYFANLRDRNSRTYFANPGSDRVRHFRPRRDRIGIFPLGIYFPRISMYFCNRNNNSQFM